MTKKAKIEALFREGKALEEIESLTGFSRGYVSNVLCNIRHPGLLRAAQDRWARKSGWRSSPRAREARKMWRKNHRMEAAEHRRRMRRGHQKATLPFAQKRMQDWTMEEIGYLEKNGAVMSIRQMAMALGRTFVGVQMKARRMGFDLRGQKTGAEAGYLKASYRTEQGGEGMRFRTKTAKEVRAMHEKVAGELTRAALPAAEEDTAAPEARSPLRVKFEASLYRWSEARPHEAKRLANKLSIWAGAFPENVTLWTLVEERLVVISAEKNAAGVERISDRQARKGNVPVPIRRATPETVVDWLFESPIADEWMYRFTQRPWWK